MEGGRNGSFAYNHPSSHAHMAYEGRLYDGIQKSHWNLQKVVSHPILLCRPGVRQKYVCNTMYRDHNASVNLHRRCLSLLSDAVDAALETLHTWMIS